MRDFPLFPLGLVALPSELIPLHIFEERKLGAATVTPEEVLEAYDDFSTNGTKG